MASSASIASLTFENANVVGDDDTAVLAGRVYSETFINNIKVSNSTITGDSDIGGIVGRLETDSIGNIELNNVTVTTNSQYGSYIGGAIGKSSAAILGVKINGITVSGSSYVGSITGYTDTDIIGATLKGNVTVTGTKNYAGGIAGYVHITGAFGSDTRGLLTQLTDFNIDTSSFNVSGVNYVGGLVGSNLADISIINSNQITVTGTGNNVGGLVGEDRDGSISYINTNKIIVNAGNDDDKTENIGGLVGHSSPRDIYQININEIEINTSNTQNVGGYFGDSLYIETYAFVNIGSISIEGSNNEDVGGFIGHASWGTYANINLNNVNINVSSSTYVGGIAGFLYNYNIENSSVNNLTITATSSEAVGGVTGAAKDGTIIKNVAINGTVTGDTKVGGIAGRLYYATILSSLSNVIVTGTTQVGGIAGYDYDSYIFGGVVIGGSITATGNNSLHGSIVGYVNRSGSYDGNYIAQTLYEAGTEDSVSGTAFTGGLSHFNEQTYYYDDKDNPILLTPTTKTSSTPAWIDISNGKYIIVYKEKDAIPECSSLVYSGNTYNINSKNDLICLIKMSKGADGEQFKGKIIKLNTDINAEYFTSLSGDLDATKAYFNEITDGVGDDLAISSFKGTFDGNNHTISNLPGPLFGALGYDSKVKNLTLYGTAPISNGEIGTVAAYANGATIDKVYVDNLTSATEDDLGGFVKIARYTTFSTIGISNSSMWQNSSNSVGGIAGLLIRSSIVGVTITNTSITTSSRSVGLIAGNEIFMNSVNSTVSNKTIVNSTINDTTYNE